MNTAERGGRKRVIPVPKREYGGQWIVVCLLILVFSLPLSAQNNANENTALIDQLKANSRSLTFKEGRIAGEGADFLFREADKAQFFLIGEEHGTAENPLFAAAVLREIQHFGYRYFASE